MYPSSHDAMYPNHTIKNSLKRFSSEAIERIREIKEEIYDMIIDEGMGVSTHIDSMVPVLAKEALGQERDQLLLKSQETPTKVIH